jgi:hypothetical protein
MQSSKVPVDAANGHLAVKWPYGRGFQVGATKRSKKREMRKQKKTSRQLADIIATRIKVDRISVSVQPDPVFGWHPLVVTKSGTYASPTQSLADEIARELRKKYDLDDHG